ncbi:DNA replication/repair protein RecF [Xinfangfangia sp. D13-10-4-6]|uniref:DNA replication/repair protein RecF n=1 Tax=Pseudogemmobacter hezensis TaxID=2737662 RepID=UPI001557BF37|nr:DNA replication/repair protein RecF [Pseudogemmobacter hezensis]NPD17528.1 DNA replication/repair protein RecF [Pseudogemmobacter hezensis]
MGGLLVNALSLSHFRSHRGLQLEFDGRPVAISGANGAGKTNILEAVSLLSPGRGLRGASSEEFIRRPEAIGWKISAEVTGAGGYHQLETWAEPASPRQVRLDGKAATQLALGQVMRVLWLVPTMDRLWTEGAEGRRRFLDRMALSFFPDHAEAALSYEKAMRQRNRLFRDEVTDPHWYGALEARMSETGAILAANRTAVLQRLTQAQEGAVSAFPRAELTLSFPEGDGGADLAQALAASRRRDMAAGRALIGPHRADLEAIYSARGVPVALCSTGEQKALLISLILANARALAADTGFAPILLLDEVAAHLDAGRRAALYDEICALGAQALMTGTDASLFDSLGDRAQTLIVANENGQSKVNQ